MTQHALNYFGFFFFFFLFYDLPPGPSRSKNASMTDTPRINYFLFYLFWLFFLGTSQGVSRMTAFYYGVGADKLGSRWYKSCKVKSHLVLFFRLGLRRFLPIYECWLLVELMSLVFFLLYLAGDFVLASRFSLPFSCHWFRVFPFFFSFFYFYVYFAFGFRWDKLATKNKMEKNKIGVQGKRRFGAGSSCDNAFSQARTHITSPNCNIFCFLLLLFFPTHRKSSTCREFV